MSAHIALVVDVDGVVSPIHGQTAWGDDTSAGWLFGPVTISPTLNTLLDQLGERPEVVPVWLTDWDAEMRAEMTGFPGAAWPSLARPSNGDAWPTLPWPKWWALNAWLDNHPHVTHLLWADDHLRNHVLTDEVTDGPPLRRREWCTTHLTQRGITSHLIAPHTSRGLTPAHLKQMTQRINAWAATAGPIPA